MVDESMGKNTEVKRIMKEQFISYMELRRKIGQTTEDLTLKEIKVTNCKKKGFYWKADFKVSYKVNGRVPVKVMNRFLKAKEEVF